MSLRRHLRRVIVWLQRHGHYTRSWEAVLIQRWLCPDTGDVILDVGCGDGYWAAQQLSMGSTVLGLDPSQVLLREAADRGLKVVSGKAEQLPFPGKSFDKVMSICAIEHFESDQLAVAELRRVLRMGGLVAITADSYRMPQIPLGFIHWHRHRFSVVKYYSLDELTGLFQQHGFVVTDARYLVSTGLYVRLGLYQLNSGFSVLSLCIGVVLNPLMRLMDDVFGDRKGGVKIALRGVRVR